MRTNVNNRIMKFTVIAILMLAIFAIASITANAGVATGRAKVDATSGAYLRSKASINSSIVTSLKNNTELVLYKEVFTSSSNRDKTKRWYYVSANGKKGYIRSDLVKNTSYTKVSAKTTDVLNYRYGAGTKMKRAGTFKKNSSVSVVLEAKAYNSSQKWYKLKVGSYYRYVCAEWIRFDTSNSGDTATGEAPNFTSRSMSKPTLISTGQDFPIAGEVSCDQEITSVKVGVVNSKGKWATKKTELLGGYVYNVGDADEYVCFDTLTAGSYTYKVKLCVNGSWYTGYEREFVVRDAKASKKLAKTAFKLAWPAGTDSDVYAYNGGSATDEFKRAIKEAYGSRKTWGAAPRAGASCDVFIGTVVRDSGYDEEMPRGLDGMWTHLPKSDKWKKIAFTGNEDELETGDIIIYSKTNSGHVCMYVKKSGKGYIAEAHYKKTYGYIETSEYAKACRIKLSDKEKISIYRAVN